MEESFKAKSVQSIAEIVKDVERIVSRITSLDILRVQQIHDGIVAVTLPYELATGLTTMKFLKGCNRTNILREDELNEARNAYRKRGGYADEEKVSLTVIDLYKSLCSSDFALSNYCVDTQVGDISVDYEVGVGGGEKEVIDCKLSTIITKGDGYVADISVVSGISLGFTYLFEISIFVKEYRGRSLIIKMAPDKETGLELIQSRALDLICGIRDQMKDSGNSELFKNVAIAKQISYLLVDYINRTLLDTRVLRRKRTRVNKETGKREYVAPPKKKEYTLDELRTKIVYMDDSVNPLPKKSYERHSDGWEVGGHMRRYKNGKEVWIAPFDKGKKSKGKVIKL